MKTLNKLIFTVYNEKFFLFIVSGDRLVEAQCFPGYDDLPVGTICVGKVKNVVKDLDAAFIEYAPGVNGYYSMKNAPERLQTGDELPVQIAREPAKSKDAVLSTRLEISGRYVVVTSARTDMGISSKIHDAEWKENIHREWESMSPEDRPFGVIVRTNAYGADTGEIWDEYRKLCDALERAVKNASMRTPDSILYMPDSFVVSAAKNSYRADSEEIITDIPEVYEELKNSLPGANIRLYDDPDYPLIKLYRIDTLMERATSKYVRLRSGGYIVIESAEALTSIDVNSGKNIYRRGHEDVYLKTNLEAAEEIAAQIRLRNLSGIIIIDFINLSDKKEQELLISEFRKYLAEDPIQTNLVDMTTLGLVEVTRKRIREPLSEQIFVDKKSGR